MRALNATIALYPNPAMRDVLASELPKDLSTFPPYSQADWPPEFDFPMSIDEALARYPVASLPASPGIPGLTPASESIASTPRQPPIATLKSDMSPASSNPSALRLLGHSLQTSTQPPYQLIPAQTASPLRKKSYTSLLKEACQVSAQPPSIRRPRSRSSSPGLGDDVSEGDVLLADSKDDDYEPDGEEEEEDELKSTSPAPYVSSFRSPSC